MSRVAILRCESYERVAQVVWDGIRLLAPQVAGKRVLLKPNLVEYSPSACINTHPYAYTSSMGGNEIAGAVGRAVVREAASPALAASVAAIEARFVERFAALRRRRQAVFAEGTVCGGIATIGVRDHATARRIAAALPGLGVLPHSVSVTDPAVVKFMPVLTAGTGVVDEIAEALDRAAGIA